MSPIHGQTIPTSHAPRLNDAAGNVYGNFHLEGDSQAIFGNVYLALPNTRLFGLGTAMRIGLHSIQTERVLHRSFNVPLVFAVMRETIVRNSFHFSERRHHFQLTLFERYRLHLSYSVDPQGDIYLRLYRPRLQFIVPPHNDLLAGCRDGDVFQVRDVLKRRAARPNDVTTANFSALYFAIENKHERIVQELLEHGADVNQRFGKNSTSPLAWALRKRDEGIVRLLIRYGAELDTINNDGWSVFEYLWAGRDEPQPSCLTFLRLLQTSDSSVTDHIGRNNVDADGWNLLCRVASLGTAEEVSFMLQYGADVYWKNMYDWNAVFEAACSDKVDTLRTLLPYFPDFRELRDVRGWTLLHVAAVEGHYETTRFLLEQGMDWQTRSWPYSTDVPECLIGVACTPATAAGVQSEERKAAYLDVVREVIGNSNED